MKWITRNKRYLGLVAMGVLGILYTSEVIDGTLLTTLGGAVTAITGVAFAKVHQEKKKQK